MKILSEEDIWDFMKETHMNRYIERYIKINEEQFKDILVAHGVSPSRVHRQLCNIFSSFTLTVPTIHSTS